MTTQTQLLNHLARHQGVANGIAADRLAALLGVPPRQLRKLISEAREDGIAICGKPSSGYFMPTTPQELQQTCDFLEHRAMHSLRKLSRMKRVALPVLMGQLLLKQG
jgi:biotin operon repressor